ncbi:Interleukin-20 receptor subunit alpha [Channa argus]|uniref:Interleukin-20 receptor subunit alpha n=2 Tax=Channa argus TaxID=215402 RepID=A0A6G1PR62_CHAAH|nr:Interleukin-20 receptor subunit alpha [Channa argus]
MDARRKTLLLLLLVIGLYCVSGVPQPANMVVNILDGEVIVHWKPPADISSDIKYNVEMAKYVDRWEKVDSCTGITRTFCDLSSLIHDYRVSYKVKVQLVRGEDSSSWTSKRFLPSESELLPPSFTLWATSSTLSVYVHQKPILRKLFPYGVTYTIYLEERGENNKTTKAYLKDDVEEDQRVQTFSPLHWGNEYCVSIEVEGNGALYTSNMSPKQCLHLPEQEWFILAVSSLSILGVLTLIAIMAAVLLCYLKGPVKTPAVLKSPVSGWLPLAVGEGTMEVVTDKGWFLTSHQRTEAKNCVKDPLTHVTVKEDSGEEDRRTSLDSGISIESNSAANNGGSPPTRQDDSGCESLGGSEGSTSCQADYPTQDERTNTNTVRKREDSGVGMGFQLDSSPIPLDGQESRPLKESVVGGNYCSQSPSVDHIQVCDDVEEFKQIHPDIVLAEVVTGYRAGPQSCICLGAGQCTWCHKQGHYGTQLIKQYRAMCIENGLLNSKCDFVNSYKAGLTFPSYSGETQTGTVVTEDLEQTFLQLGENFPLLKSLSSLSPVEGERDFNMNNVSLSLCDIQLETD